MRYPVETRDQRADSNHRIARVARGRKWRNRTATNNVTFPVRISITSNADVNHGANTPKFR